MTYATNSAHRLCTAKSLIDTPLGPLLLARTPHGLAGAWFMNQKDHPGDLNIPDAPNDHLLAETAQQFEVYFKGVVPPFDMPLDLHGTPFQRRVWEALLRIERGRTRSYGDIAREVSDLAAVRAVGSAVGKNPVSVIVPCHRVIGANGTLTGYAGGLHRKQALLELEGVLQRTATSGDLFEAA